MVVQHPDHVALRDAQERRLHDGRRRRHAQRLPGQAALAEEIARAEHGHDRLLAPRGQHRELDAAALGVEHAGRLGTLGEDDGASRKSHGACSDTSGLEEGLNIKGRRRGPGL